MGQSLQGRLQGLWKASDIVSNIFDTFGRQVYPSHKAKGIYSFAHLGSLTERSLEGKRLPDGPVRSGGIG